MANDVNAAIVDDLNNAGFPAEVKTAAILSSKKWIVYNGALFEDPETKKSRELDIHSVFVDYSYADQVKNKTKSGDENKLISHLIIEVKKSTKPWVFFNNGGDFWPQIPFQNFKSERKYFHALLQLDFGVSGLANHRYLGTKLHKNYHVSFSDPSKVSSIYESLIKITKALNYFKENYGSGGYCLHLFTPIVILDGTLWSATLGSGGETKVEEADSLYTIFSQLVKDEKSNHFYEEQQICEIITLNQFEKQLKIIEKDNKNIYKLWTDSIIEDEKTK